MATDAEKLNAEIKRIIAELSRKQAEILTKRLSVSFVAGYRSTNAKPEISRLQENAIKKISKDSMGAITEYNNALGAQLAEKVKTDIKNGMGYEEIRKDMVPYIKQVFNSEKTVTMNHIGDTRTEYYVDRDGKIHPREVTITQEYSASIDTYSKTAATSTTHRAYEAGRAEGYQADGIEQWRFVGPVDIERSRPWHAALLGNIYTYGTPESDAAAEILQE